ncbi:hypothetical protein LPTSP4_03530 [Leptospira ryugenii]|uniref:Uncharacterized protein n=1 Tax=Leptospira ryugenii TaxID=1917863 RepID=A0A2P2DW47_9LEPT|nr:hypothetical protein LPTSP4_03530 [Leptospira ryugenii]
MVSFLVIMFFERWSSDYLNRSERYRDKQSLEVIDLLDSMTLKITDSDSFLFITKDGGEMIRTPLLLGIERNITMVNGYSGYQPKEWKYFSMMVEDHINCSEAFQKNEFLLLHSKYLIIEKSLPINKTCDRFQTEYRILNESNRFQVLVRNI